MEMGQPGWKGCLRVAGLFMAGIFVGGLGAGIAEHDKYLVGSSPGTYALIMAHLGMKNQVKNLKVKGVLVLSMSNRWSTPLYGPKTVF